MRDAGIVYMASGPYWPYLYASVRLLREKGCRLPVTIYSLEGLSARARAVGEGLAACGVELVDGKGFSRFRGWDAKPTCILRAPYRHVMYLDSDVFLVSDGAWMLDDPRYLAAGSVQWIDPQPVPPGAPWAEAGLEYCRSPGFDAGVMLIDKEQCGESLELAARLVRSPAWVYGKGDACCFFLAWRAMGLRPYVVRTRRRELARVHVQADLRERDWVWHVTNRAKAAIRVRFCVKEIPDCQRIRQFVAEYDALSHPSSLIPHPFP